MRVVAIDQGTTSTRAFVLDETGMGQVVCTRTHRQIYPRPGWVEHDPEELLGDIKHCLDAAGPVDGASIDNQGESCLAWNGETGEPISPVIVWQDRRTAAKIEQLKADGAEDLTMTRSGLPLDPYFSASKIAWIIQHIPAARSLLGQGKLRLGTTDAFFLDRLTGNFVTDITTASRTSLLNLETRQWDEELCALFGVPREALPQIRPTMADFGTINLGAQKIALLASAVDQQASLYGHGCRETGDAKITFGTGAFALVVTGKSIMRAPEKGLLPTVAWQKAQEAPVYAIDGGVYCAGSALNWAKSLGLFQSFNDINSFDAPSAISRDLVFVPALTGLGCPFWDGSAAGMWLGMSLDTKARDLVQAILEGIAFRTAQVVDAMAEQIKIGNDISIDGGMSANPYFCQFLADALQKNIIVQSMAELTGFGMAQMAIDSVHRKGGDPMGRTENGCVGKQFYQPGIASNDGKIKFLSAVSRSQNWRR